MISTRGARKTSRDPASFVRQREGSPFDNTPSARQVNVRQQLIDSGFFADLPSATGNFGVSLPATSKVAQEKLTRPFRRPLRQDAA